MTYLFFFFSTFFCSAEVVKFDDFLGTLGGKQVYLNSVEKNGQKTYSRSFTPFGPADVRRDISTARSKGWKTLGEGYSFTPYRLRDGRPFGSRPTSM